jgi:mannose-1-phosphate guanylyltransferase
VRTSEVSDSVHHHRWAVVLAGGEGSRLQSLTHFISGDRRPKQFCPIFGGKSLLTHTRERIAPLFEEDHTLIVLSRAHELYFRDELADVRGSCTVVQPANRGTAVAMAVCLRTIISQEEDALVAFFPSDHHYTNCPAFRSWIEAGLYAAAQYPNYLVVLGAEARYPEVEYGWIEPGRTLDDSLVHPVERVSRFWEKPDFDQASSLRKRGCLWNTFVTIGLASAFLEIFQLTIPQLAHAADGQGPLERYYAGIPARDFANDVLVRVPHRLLVLRDADSGWTDFGNPRRVIDTLTRQGVRPPWLNTGEHLSI